MRPIIARLIIIALTGSLASCGQARPGDRLDSTHIDTALTAFRQDDPDVLGTLENGAAMAHLQRHAGRTGYYSRETTDRQIIEDLIHLDDPVQTGRALPAQQLRDRIVGDPERQQTCFGEARSHWPEDWREPVTVYLTWGYDIGVASDLGASLNLAHPHFLEQPDEVWFYCVHEVHHVGLIRRHEFPDIPGLETRGDLLAAVRYLTFLEGTAVYAAHDWRAREAALDADGDYAALQNPARMEVISAHYLEYLDTLSDRPPGEAISDADWEIIEEMSGGDRLWYRHGAFMAAEIDEVLGRAAYLEVLENGPDAFFAAFEALAETAR
ncbi:hypothetical protein V0U79_11330 [Hyphobacterium sp. HN65]|uniref:Aminopeptidase n=1 Tax=Hyphobacterium lacteum TaxID=3116575 RepID=A0ABU7LSU0_9PROT|nr:hypothetical protein [Hyphobacterium sp. HN65]MEE2526963.1 hypothetical protein [Hyphobacterium sp. HN65]